MDFCYQKPAVALTEVGERRDTAFIEGYELGRLAEHMQHSVRRIDCLVYSAIGGALLDLAAREGWTAKIGPSVEPGFSLFQASRVVRRLKIIAAADGNRRDRTPLDYSGL